MEGAHSLSNFISQLPRAHVLSSLPASPIPDVKLSWGSDPLYYPKWPETLSQNDPKATPAGPWNALFSQASMYVFKGKELVHIRQRDLWIPSCPLHEMLFFQYPTETLLLSEGVWGEGESMRAPLKDHPSHLDFLSTGTVEWHLSSFTPGSLCGTSLLLPWVFLLHGSFQLTPFVSVIRQIRRSTITVSVVSHSFRSMGLLSQRALLDCSAWGIIDQYQVCSLVYLWLVHLTHSVLISYAALLHILGLSF